MKLDAPEMPSTIAISYHPPSEAFAAAIKQEFGERTIIYCAGGMRTMSPRRILREIRSLSADLLVIAIEHDAARRLAAPLSMAAALSPAKELVIFWPDGQTERVSRARAITAAFSLVRATVAGRRALRRRVKRAAQLRHSAPRPPPPIHGSRILYLDMNISLGAPVGGSVGHTAGVINGFLKHGFTVDYASVKPLPTARSGATWLRLAPPNVLASPPELNHYAYAEWAERKLSQMHGALPWAFIYQRNSVHDMTGVVLARQWGIPLVLEFNHSEVWAHAHWGPALALESAAAEVEQTAVTNADFIVTVADPLVDALQQRGVRNDRIVMYPNCVDPSVFDPDRFGREDREALRTQYGIAPDALLASFIGTFGPWHGVDFLAECIRDLVAAERAWLQQHKLHFMLIGAGAKMSVVQELLGTAECQPFVTLTGVVPQDQAPRYLACADLFVSPHVPNPDGSEFFGSPTKLFEYMAMQRPLLASALDQIAQVVSGEGASRYGCCAGASGRQCGLLYTPGDHSAFKAGLKRLVEDRALGRELALAARAEVLERYTWTRHVEAVIARMQECGAITDRATPHSDLQGQSVPRQRRQEERFDRGGIRT